MYKKTKNTAIGAQLVRLLVRQFPGKVDLLNSVINDEIIAIHLDQSVAKEAGFVVNAFLTAWDKAHQIGYFEGVKTATEEYQKNILEVIESTSNEAYNRGYRNGTDDEWENSAIPSDAYDLEVFAVQPSSDFETGKQAFIGFKHDVDGQPNFNFIQVQFAVPNLTIKKKINEETRSKNLCATSSHDYGELKSH